MRTLITSDTLVSVTVYSKRKIGAFATNMLFAHTFQHSGDCSSAQHSFKRRKYVERMATYDMVPMQ